MDECAYTAGDEGDAGVDNTGYSEDGSTMYDSGGEPSTQLHNTHQAAAAMITQSNTIHNQRANPYNIRPDTYGQSESDMSLKFYTPQLAESDS